jgi:hypothetical protein
VNTGSRWVSLRSAAEALDMAPTALRRTVERRARLAEDGGIEASFDGIRARKFAGRWRVNLGPIWTRGDAASTDANARARASSSDRPKHATRPEKE